jgi:hypothetical protein
VLEALDSLRETLYAARLLREQIAALPVRPDGAARLRDEFLRENAGARADALRRVVSVPFAGTVTRDFLDAVAAAVLGAATPRTGPGASFQRRAAPPPVRVAALVEELLETVNSPVARESWPPPARACAVHFLLRLVQPWEGAPGAPAAAAETALLAADGFLPDQMLLPEPDVGVEGDGVRPDPDAFVRERLDRLVERLAESEERVRTEAARGVLLGWVEERAAQLGPRQERLLRHLAEGGLDRRLAFQDYVRLPAGRRAPSLRSLQRDWQGLRDGGFLREGADGRCGLDPDALAFGRRARRATAVTP